MAGLACSLSSNVSEETKTTLTALKPSPGGSEKKINTVSVRTSSAQPLTRGLKTMTATPVSLKPRASITPLTEPTEETGSEDLVVETLISTLKNPSIHTSTPGQNISSATPLPIMTSTSVINRTPTSTSVPSCASSLNPNFELDLLNQINAARSQLNPPSPELSRSSQLDEAALRHSKDMACTWDWFDQKGSDGSTVYDRLDDAGYEFSRASQNIFEASGLSDNPESAFNTWINLTSSKAIMLDSGFTEVGIGYVTNPNSTYEGYFTAVFATP